MRVLACTSDADPCPVTSQVWLDLAGVIDFPALGIDSISVLAAFGFGVAAVLALYFLGYAFAVVVQIIRRI